MRNNCSPMPYPTERASPSQREVIDRLGRTQNVTIISLPNYLDFVARSDAKNAVPFREWVFGEVLPSILKTGSYSVADDLLADLKKWQLSTKVVDAIVKAIQSKSVLDDKERAGYAAVLMQTLRRQIYHDTRSYEGTLEVLHGKGSIPNIKGDVVKMTAEIKNGQVIVQMQFPFDNAIESA